MKQTPVQWLYDQIGDTAPYDYAAQIASYLEEAMKMEAEIPELSDEEIEESSKYIQTTNPDLWTFKIAWKSGAKWYREQLKQRQ